MPRPETEHLVEAALAALRAARQTARPHRRHRHRQRRDRDRAGGRTARCVGVRHRHLARRDRRRAPQRRAQQRLPASARSCTAIWPRRWRASRRSTRSSRTCRTSRRRAIPVAPDPVAFEPSLALDGGADGLALYRRLIAQLPALLAPQATRPVRSGAGHDRAAGRAGRGGFSRRARGDRLRLCRLAAFSDATRYAGKGRTP